MSTGYTYLIKDGISFNDFVMKCARAMGYLITMRDDSMDKEIPEKFEPSNYHQKELTRAKSKLKLYQEMKDDQANLLSQQEHDNSIKYQQESIDERNKLKKQYENMLFKIRKWKLPTSEHKGLKEFMIEQITDSIDFDCDTEYPIKNSSKSLSGKEWLSMKISTILKEIKYHTKKDQEERERTESRNLWIKQLRESLI